MVTIQLKDIYDNGLNTQILADQSRLHFLIEVNSFSIFSKNQSQVICMSFSQKCHCATHCILIILRLHPTERPAWLSNTFASKWSAHGMGDSCKQWRSSLRSASHAWLPHRYTQTPAHTYKEAHPHIT